MTAETIFLPMLATMALTTVAWFYMYAQRIAAMRRAGLSVQAYTTPDKTQRHLPDEVSFSAN